MEFFDGIKETVTKTGQDAMQKAGDTVEIIRLKNRSEELKKKRAGDVQRLGLLVVNNCVYSTAGAGGKILKINPEIEEEFFELIQQVRGTELEMQTVKEQIRLLRGLILCPGCGGETEAGNAFCKNCGYRLEPKETGKNLCKNCGIPLPEDALFCVNCGMKVENVPEEVLQQELEIKKVRSCPECGTELEEDDIFCSECGNRL